MLRASIRTTGRTWPIRPGEPTFISTMVTRLTGKKCPARRKPPLIISRESGRLDLTGRPIFHRRTAIICESWMSFWDRSIELLSPLPAASTVKRSCGLSLPSFAWPALFSELLWQFSSSWVSLQLELAIPVRAGSPCDGGHGAMAGCAQLLLPSAVGRLFFFGALPQGMRDSF